MGGTVATRAENVDMKSISKHSKTANFGSSGKNDAATEKELIELLYPIYYNIEPITAHEKQKAIESFHLISGNQSEEFYRMKKEDPTTITCNSPMEFFGNRFYKRLIEIHPTCQPLFAKSTMKQGTLLLRMMSLVVADLQNPDPEKFKKTFEAIANSHNRIGVRAAECKYLLSYSVPSHVSFSILDGLFGEVLFWTIKLCVGKAVYDMPTHTAWVKIYSRMLSHIVPIAVKYELQHKESIHRSDIKRMESFVTSTSSTFTSVKSNMEERVPETSAPSVAAGISHHVISNHAA